MTYKSATDRQQIEHYLKTVGVTQCAPAYAAPVQGAQQVKCRQTWHMPPQGYSGPPVPRTIVELPPPQQRENAYYSRNITKKKAPAATEPQKPKVQRKRITVKRNIQRKVLNAKKV